MPKFLLAVLMLTAGVCRADEPAFPVTQTWEKAGVIATRVFGRLLGSLIEEGMTDQQVAGILGRHDARGWILSGALCVEFKSYGRLGVSVVLVADAMGVLRVTQVTFQPLFD